MHNSRTPPMVAGQPTGHPGSYCAWPIKKNNFWPKPPAKLSQANRLMAVVSQISIFQTFLYLRFSFEIFYLIHAYKIQFIFKETSGSQHFWSVNLYFKKTKTVLSELIAVPPMRIFFLLNISYGYI